MLYQLHFHDFAPVGLSPHDAHSGPRHAEMLRQGFDDGLSSLTLPGRRRYRDAEVGGVYPLDAFAPGSWDDDHSDAHLTTTFQNRTFSLFVSWKVVQSCICGCRGEAAIPAHEGNGFLCLGLELHARNQMNGIVGAEVVLFSYIASA